MLLGNGDGTFQAQLNTGGRLTLPSSWATSMATAALTWPSPTTTTNDVSLLLGNGDGTFQSPVTYAVGSQPLGIAAGDFNGDGRIDLAAANSGSNDVSLLLNLNGTFVAPGSLVTNFLATPLVADLTGDGTDDVFVVNAAGDILWRKGRPQVPGTFDPPVTINPGHLSRDIIAVDTNQGPLLASVDATDNAVSLYAWRDGSFVLIGSLPTGLLPAQIVAADLTGDGWNDLVVRNAGDGTLSVFLNSGSESGPTRRSPFPAPAGSAGRPWRLGRDPGGCLG